MNTIATRRSTALAIAVAILAALAGLWAGRMLLGPRVPPQTEATLLNRPRALPALALVDQHGQALGLDRLQGKWSLFFFGFTHCPDVCPTTLSTLAAAARLLAELPEPQRPQVVFVTVDPERDTPQVLAEYARFFDPAFLAASASPEATAALAGQLGVAYQKVPRDGGGYTMDHSAALFLFNPRAELNAIFSPPHTAAGIANDYRLITDYLEGS